MTVFLIIALVVLTLLSLIFAFMAGYGAALKDRLEKKDKSKEALIAFFEFAKGFIEYMNSHENDPEDPEHPEATQEPEPGNEEAAEK